MYQNCLLDLVRKKGEGKGLLSAAEGPSSNGLESAKQEVGAWDRAVTRLAAHADKKDALSAPQYTPLVSRESNARRTLTRDLGVCLAKLDEAIMLMERLSGTSSANNSSLRAPHDPARVLLVHKHAEGMRERADYFLEIAGLGPISLCEQPNMGETTIEKLEGYAHADFAVVLLTADDEGQALNERALRPRARQGVVFGAGLLMGHIGRGRVALLLERDVKPPADTRGILCIPLDKQRNWGWRLFKELYSRSMRASWNKQPCGEKAAAA